MYIVVFLIVISIAFMVIAYSQDIKPDYTHLESEIVDCLWFNHRSIGLQGYGYWGIKAIARFTDTKQLRITLDAEEPFKFPMVSKLQTKININPWIDVDANVKCIVDILRIELMKACKRNEAL